MDDDSGDGIVRIYHVPVYPILHLRPICVVTNLPKSVIAMMMIVIMLIATMVIAMMMSVIIAIIAIVTHDLIVLVAFIVLVITQMRGI